MNSVKRKPRWARFETRGQDKLRIKMKWLSGSALGSMADMADIVSQAHLRI